MHMKRTLIIGTALAALLLSGCEALQDCLLYTSDAADE